MNTVVCTQCGTENQDAARFCKSCGHELSKPVVDTSQWAPLVPDKRARRRKNTIGIIVGVVGFAILCSLVYYFFIKGAVMDKVLEATATQINNSCPMMIDEETRLESAEALPGKILKYNYTLVHIGKGEIPVDTLKKYLEPSILQNAKSSPDMEVFRKLKTSFVFHYNDKDGGFLHEYTVTPEMYE